MIEPYIIPIGTKLYRFVGKPPSEINLGMSQNKGNDGRCNYYRNVYYCSKSIEGILQEMSLNGQLQGSLIVSTVVKEICCGVVVDTFGAGLLKARHYKKEPSFFEKEFAKYSGIDISTDYHTTSKIAENVFRCYGDGLVYSSANSMDTVIDGIRFQADESTGLSNIALTEQGYLKIIESMPVVYWHK